MHSLWAEHFFCSVGIRLAWSSLRARPQPSTLRYMLFSWVAGGARTLVRPSLHYPGCFFFKLSRHGPAPETALREFAHKGAATRHRRPTPSFSFCASPSTLFFLATCENTWCAVAPLQISSWPCFIQGLIINMILLKRSSSHVAFSFAGFSIINKYYWDVLQLLKACHNFAVVKVWRR